MAILKRPIFGEVLHVGELDDTLRELVTTTVLAANQTLPQLGAHVSAALNCGASPIAIRETIYQWCAFPRLSQNVERHRRDERGISRQGHPRPSVHGLSARAEGHPPGKGHCRLTARLCLGTS